MSSIPTIAGRYRLDERSGEVEGCQLYRGVDLELERPVTVTVVTHADERSRARLFDELQSLARLNHPSIVRLYDAGTHEDGVYLVSERLQGRTLRAAAREAALDGGHLLRIAAATASALAHAHAQGVTHRDVTADAIVIEPDGTPRLRGFGVARLAGESTAPMAQSAAGPDAAAAADVFALGTVLAGCLAGCAKAPETLVQALEAMTSPDPEERLTAAQAAAALEFAAARQEPRPVVADDDATRVHETVPVGTATPRRWYARGGLAAVMAALATLMVAVVIFGDASPGIAEHTEIGPAATLADALDQLDLAVAETGVGVLAPASDTVRGLAAAGDAVGADAALEVLRGLVGHLVETEELAHTAGARVRAAADEVAVHLPTLTPEPPDAGQASSDAAAQPQPEAGSQPAQHGEARGSGPGSRGGPPPHARGGRGG